MLLVDIRNKSPGIPTGSVLVSIEFDNNDSTQLLIDELLGKIFAQSSSLDEPRCEC